MVNELRTRKVVLEKLTVVVWLVQKFPAIYATWRLFTVFARFHSWHLPRPWWISSTFLRSVPVWFILILSGCVCQDPHKWSAWIIKYAESQRIDLDNTCTWNINAFLHAKLHIPWVCIITCRALILSCCVLHSHWSSCFNCSPSQALLTWLRICDFTFARLDL